MYIEEISQNKWTIYINKKTIFIFLAFCKENVISHICSPGIFYFCAFKQIRKQSN